MLWYTPSTRTRVPSFGQTFPNKVGPCQQYRYVGPQHQHKSTVYLLTYLYLSLTQLASAFRPCLQQLI